MPQRWAKPCKGAIELNARGYFALAGLHRSPGGTQGCTPSSLTLSYHIARPSAFNTKSIGVGTGILLPAPPSEPDGRFSRIRLSSQ